MKITSFYKVANQALSQYGKAPDHFSAADKLLLVALFAVPLLINPGVFGNFDETYLYPKLLLLYVIIVPSSLLILLNWQIHWTGIRSLALTFAFWLTWMACSTLFTEAGWTGWWGQTDRADGVLMHGIYALLALAGWQWAQHDVAWRTKLAWVVLPAGALVALSNVLQQLHLVGIANQNAFTGVVATPFGGTLRHRGYMGGYMALILPVALWLSRDLIGKWRSWANVGITLMAWALLGSFSRGPWLAGLLGGLWYLVYARPTWKNWWPILIALLLFWPTTQLFKNARALSVGGKNGQSINDTSGRTVLWNSALVGIRYKPLLGWGSPAILQVMNTRPDRQLLSENGVISIGKAFKLNVGNKTMPIFRVIDNKGKVETVTLGGAVDKVHNEYLDYALTYGVPAALIFIMLLAWAIWASRYTAPGLSAGLVAFGVYIFFWPEVVRFAPIAWFFLGLAISAGHQSTKVNS